MLLKFGPRIRSLEMLSTYWVRELSLSTWNNYDANLKPSSTVPAIYSTTVQICFRRRRIVCIVSSTVKSDPSYCEGCTELLQVTLLSMLLASLLRLNRLLLYEQARNETDTGERRHYVPYNLKCLSISFKDTGKHLG